MDAWRASKLQAVALQAAVTTKETIFRKHDGPETPLSYTGIRNKHKGLRAELEKKRTTQKKAVDLQAGTECEDVLESLGRDGSKSEPAEDGQPEPPFDDAAAAESPDSEEAA